MNKPIPFGKYYLLERINVGGMAEVFRAKQFGVEGFERLVAVKRILPNIAEDKDFIEMFVDEAKISVQLNHANIAQVFDLGHEEGSYYIALEHIHGRDLRAIFDRNRKQGQPMPVPQACFVTMKVCEGLDYAHNKRDEGGTEISLVHRDVSPQNVLVSFDGEVKIIDFGIAKAAGKGSQTQAGILKGKFGYMSPEQVRGLPVDRRSDVFSCGIVLYELLTGERLFVGESDFSTLEKVRNVEILPPSTYNRKIQPELERIVLKALAKDVEDRYHNAIDLHDELQAFVYTSGEFYSRKDLATWMKGQWAKEIKEESAKIASYSDMSPPPAQAAIASPQPGRASTLSLNARKTNPPPIPGVRPSASQPPPIAQAKGNGLEWDDDELETSIYDDIDQPIPAPASVLTPAAGPSAFAARASATMPSAPPLMGSALSPSGDTAVTAQDEEPDLSSLVATTHGWDAPQPTEASDSPSRVADGSNKTKSPFGSTLGAQPALPVEPVGTNSEASRPGEVSAVLRMANLAATQAPEGQPILDSDFVSAVVPPRRSNLLYGIVAISIMVAGGIVAVVLAGQNNKSDAAAVAGSVEDGLATGDSDTPDHETPGESTPGAASVGSPSADTADLGTGSEPTKPVTGIANAATGFDLIVDPPGVKVSLDGRPIGKAPLQIRSVPEGEHFIEIEAPPGYFSKHETVTVANGSAERVVIQLVAMEITGKFVSTPVGASVYLATNGVSELIGTAPMEYKLDPRKTYEVSFKKDGYTTLTNPISINGQPEITLAGTLLRSRIRTKADGAQARANVPKVAIKAAEPDVPRIASDKTSPEAITERVKPIRPKPPVSEEMGTLMLIAKPPCQIFIDGRNTGKKTPQRGIKLSVGPHRVTLINNEFGISESFKVKIKADTETKQVQNYTDQIP